MDRGRKEEGRTGEGEGTGKESRVSLEEIPHQRALASRHKEAVTICDLLLE